MSSTKHKRPASAQRPAQTTGFFERALQGSEKDSKLTSFKDRGVDEAQWRGKCSPFDSPDTMQLKKLKLHNPALAIAEDASTDGRKIRVNRDGVKKGYDPYDSGRLAKAAAARRRNLRRLGEGLKIRKGAKKDKQSDV